MDIGRNDPLFHEADKQFDFLVLRNGRHGKSPKLWPAGQLVFGDLQLDVLSGFVCDPLILFDDLKGDPFNIISQVFDAVYLDLEFPDQKKLLRYFDRKIVPDFDLAGKPDIFLQFFSGKIGCFCGQHRPAPVQNLHFAIGARPLAPAGRRDEYSFILQAEKQRAPPLHFQLLLFVDQNIALAVVGDKPVGQFQENRQQGTDPAYDQYADDYLRHFFTARGSCR